MKLEINCDIYMMPYLTASAAGFANVKALVSKLQDVQDFKVGI